MVNDKKWVTLNVGGTTFTTSRSTLIKNTPVNSPLYRISNSSTNVEWDRNEKGHYMIDRDPAYFQVILNFLRHGRVLLTPDVTDEGLLLEAEYFNLPELAKVVQQRMSQRDLTSMAKIQFYHQLQQLIGSHRNNISGALYADQLSSYANLSDATAYMPASNKLNKGILNPSSIGSQQQQLETALPSIKLAPPPDFDTLFNRQGYLSSLVQNVLEENPNQAPMSF